MFCFRYQIRFRPTRDAGHVYPTPRAQLNFNKKPASEDADAYGTKGKSYASAMLNHLGNSRRFKY